MTQSPTFTPVTKPSSSTVATVSSDEVHSTGAYGLEAFKINCNVPAT